MAWLISRIRAKAHQAHGWPRTRRMADRETEDWLAEEEQAQLREVAARLDRVREQLSKIDRRRQPREGAI